MDRCSNTSSEKQIALVTYEERQLFTEYGKDSYWYDYWQHGHKYTAVWYSESITIISTSSFPFTSNQPFAKLQAAVLIFHDTCMFMCINI